MPAVVEQSQVDEMAAALEDRPALHILKWAAALYAPHVTLLTGFGAEGCVLLDLVGTHRLPISVVTLDTGLLFPETYDLWRRLELRYGFTVRAVRPRQTVAQQERTHGARLWERDPDRCCGLRKVEPLERALAGQAAWISAIRRDQSPERAAAPVVQWDQRFGLLKVNPLAHWTADDVWTHLRRRGVPYNPLHEQGYPSIGCLPCTSPVTPGEDGRAGRWRGRGKRECGLHLPVLAR